MPWTADAIAHVALFFMVSIAAVPYFSCATAVGGGRDCAFSYVVLLPFVGDSTFCRQGRCCARHHGNMISSPPVMDPYAYAVGSGSLYLIFCICISGRGNRTTCVQASTMIDLSIVIGRKFQEYSVVRPTHPSPTSRRYIFWLQKCTSTCKHGRTNFKCPRCHLICFDLLWMRWCVGGMLLTLLSRRPRARRCVGG